MNTFDPVPTADAIETVPRSGNGLAITALTCGLIGIVLCPVGLVGLIFGIVALCKRQSIGMAVTGIVAGGIGFLFMPIIAAIAIPSLLESRIAANESAACSRLKSNILIAQIQYQKAGTKDADANGIGEYGSFDELSGGGAINGNGMTYLPADFRGEHPVVKFYRFEMFLAGEKGFVAYASPIDQNMGRRAFAITAQGQLYIRKMDESRKNLTAPRNRYDLWDGEENPELSGPPSSSWAPYIR